MARWRQDLIPIMVAVLALLLCATLNAYYFAAPYFEQDTVSYHFQANLFAHGCLTAEPPPDRGFSPSVHLNIVNHKWYSLYAFGNAMVLSIGVLAGVPWLIPCLTTGIALFVLYRFLERVYGHSHALTGVVLGLISPATLVMGATSFAEVTDRLFLSVYML